MEQVVEKVVEELKQKQLLTINHSSYPLVEFDPRSTEISVLKKLTCLKENGYTIIFISHKLNEVKELCDRITIIRRGVTMGVHNVADVSEEDISRLMVGRDVVLKIEKKPAQPGTTPPLKHYRQAVKESGF